MLGDVDCEIIPTVLGAQELIAVTPGLIAAPPHVRALTELEDVVEFVVEGERLVAQRSTLARHCTFFSNMFRWDVISFLVKLCLILNFLYVVECDGNNYWYLSSTKKIANKKLTIVSGSRVCDPQIFYFFWKWFNLFYCCWIWFHLLDKHLLQLTQ